MGAIAAPVAIAQAGLQIAGARASAAEAASNAEATYEANATNLQLLVNDVARREIEVGIAEEQAVSDRVRQANQEVAQTQQLLLTSGTSASSRAQLLNVLAFTEGTDIARLRQTADSERSALDSEVEAAIASANSGNTVAQNQANSQRTSAVLGALGSGLQIAGGFATNLIEQQNAQNKV